MPNNFFRKIRTESPSATSRPAQFNEKNHGAQAAAHLVRVLPADTFTGVLSTKKHRRDLHAEWGVASSVRKKVSNKRSTRDKLMPPDFDPDTRKWLRKKLKLLSESSAAMFVDEIQKWFKLFSRESIRTQAFRLTMDEVLDTQTPEDFVKMSHMILQGTIKNISFSQGWAFLSRILVKHDAQQIESVLSALDLLGLVDLQRDNLVKLVELFIAHVPKEHYALCAQMLCPTVRKMEDDRHARDVFLLSVLNQDLFCREEKDEFDFSDEEAQEVERSDRQEIERLLNEELDLDEQTCCPLTVRENIGIPRTLDPNRATNSYASYAYDRENVMQAGRIDASLRSMQMLVNKYPSPFNPARVLYVIQHYLTFSRKTRAGARCIDAHNQINYHARQIDNAIRTMMGPRETKDYADPISTSASTFHLPSGEDLRIDELCALVWVVVTSYQNRDMTSKELIKARQNLLFSFVTSLAACIEDDGHRVCLAGTGQRLVTILQGYCGVRMDLVTPQTLLCELARDFDESLLEEEKSDQDMIDFSEYAMKIAQLHFHDDPASLEIFKQHLHEYVLLN